MSSHKSGESDRSQLIDAVAAAGRANSTATVLFHATMAQRLGIDATALKTLDMIVRTGPQSAGAIARATGLASASVTSLVDRLERKGFVRRVRDTGDRRRVHIEAVAERIAEIEPLYESMGRTFFELLAHYDARDLEIIHDFLTRTTGWLTSETQRLKDSGEPKDPCPPSPPASRKS